MPLRRHHRLGRGEVHEEGDDRARNGDDPAQEDPGHGEADLEENVGGRRVRALAPLTDFRFVGGEKRNGGGG